MTRISYPFSGEVVYEVESSYGGGFHTGASRFSDAVTDVRLETGDINMELRSISQPSVIDFEKTMEDPTLHIEYVYQPHAGDQAIEEFYTRSGCELDSLAVEVGVSTCSTTSAYYYAKGCVCKSFTVSASKGEFYTVAADFSVSELVVGSSTSVVGGSPADIDTDYATFNNAGSISWGGVTGAYVTEAFDFTVDNNITDYYDVGSTSKKQAIAGQRNITGSCDISLDDGGETHFDEVLAGTDITSIHLNTGCATGDDGEFQLENGRFDSTSIDINTSGEGIMTSVPFTFRSLSFATGS